MIRILMLGSVGVGKSSLISRFTTATYPPPYDPTLTINGRRHVSLPAWSDTDENTVLVEVINYADLQWAKTRATVHAKGDYDAVMLVYDVTSRESLEAVTMLHGEIPLQRRRKSCEGGWPFSRRTGGRKVVTCLVGNKSDCDDRHDGPSTAGTRQVTAADGASLASALGISLPFAETSAKAGENVEATFLDVIEAVLREERRAAKDLSQQNSMMVRMRNLFGRKIFCL